MNIKHHVGEDLQSPPDNEIFPANGTWLGYLIGVIVLAFSLSILFMFSY